jgi:ferredoxin
MAYKISDECIGCGACAAQCPNNAISEGDTQYKIDPNKCTECVGFYDSPQCAGICPVEAPGSDPDKKESKDQLLAKFKKLNPDKTPK